MRAATISSVRKSAHFILMPEPLAGERAAYMGCSARSGGMAARRSGRAACCQRRPHRIRAGRRCWRRADSLRREQVEAALVGQPANTETMRRAASSAGDGVRPLPMTAYKVDVLCATVLQALEHALG